MSSQNGKGKILPLAAVQCASSETGMVPSTEDKMHLNCGVQVEDIVGIKENPEGFIDVVIDNEEGYESEITFSKEQFASLGKMISEFFKTGKNSNKLGTQVEGQANFDVDIDISDAETSVDIEPTEQDDRYLAYLKLKDHGDRKAVILLNSDQAKEIRKRLDEFIASEKVWNRIKAKTQKI